MKSFYLLLFSLILAVTLHAQDSFKAPRFTKTAIGNSGCYAYLPDDKTEKKFDISYSPDSSKLYTGDFVVGDFHYSIIVVKMKDVVLNTTEDKELMLTNYLDFLKGEFRIEQSAGYGKGHTLESNPDATGMIDFWKDENKDQWAIKGWIDNTIIGIMMIYGPTEYPNINVQQVFLNGFRFR